MLVNHSLGCSSVLVARVKVCDISTQSQEIVNVWPVWQNQNRRHTACRNSTLGIEMRQAGWLELWFCRAVGTSIGQFGQQVYRQFGRHEWPKDGLLDQHEEIVNVWAVWQCRKACVAVWQCHYTATQAFCMVSLASKFTVSLCATVGRQDHWSSLRFNLKDDWWSCLLLPWKHSRIPVLREVGCLANWGCRSGRGRRLLHPQFACLLPSVC